LLRLCVQMPAMCVNTSGAATSSLIPFFYKCIFFLTSFLVLFSHRICCFFIQVFCEVNVCIDSCEIGSQCVLFFWFFMYRCYKSVLLLHNL
jgi:hypothetical protein